MKWFLPFLLAFHLHAAPNIETDVEITVMGLDCTSSAVGLKKIFRKDSRVMGL